MISALVALCTLCIIQDLPPKAVSEGTCIVLYEAGDFGIYRIVGVDIRSQSVLFYDQTQSYSVLTTPDGRTLRAREGESGFFPIAPDQALSIASAAQHFPFLLPMVLKQIDPNRIDSTRTPDGGWEISALLVIGDLNLTVLGYEPPSGPKDVSVRFIFDPAGKLLSTQREGSEVQIVEYAQAEHPQLAPALPHNYDQPGGMRIVNVETYIPGHPDLFEPSKALSRVHEFTLKHAEEQRKRIETSLATTKGQNQLRDSTRPDNGIFGWRSNRVALILTGILVIAVGSLAWWKNRS